MEASAAPGETYVYSNEWNIVYTFVDSVSVRFSTVYPQQQTPAAASQAAGQTYVFHGRYEDATNINLAQIRYTLNGKDPSRTEYQIYRGDAIRIDENTNGGDNTVIKARVYYQGQWSDVSTLVINIA